MEMLIAWAWDARDFRILNQPAWFHTDKFDITAKAWRAPDIPHLKLLMQRLLADRFRLAVHTETRQVAGYALRVDPKGHKLKPAAGPAVPGSPSLSGRINGRQSTLAGDHATMADLANALSRRLGRSVADETGLRGAFDFTFEWVPDGTEIARTMPIGSAPSAGDDDLGASLISSLKSELGLRLESRKAPANVLVVDRAERIPTGN
jgi:uncharacterized protein (TIGR03435 family)